MRSMEGFSNEHPAAKEIMGVVKDWTEKHNQEYGKLQEPLQQLHLKAHADPAIYADRDETIGAMHQRLSAAGNPAAKHTAQILQQNKHPKTGALLNADKTIESLGIQHNSQAALIARQKVFGPNLDALMPHFDTLYSSPNKQHSVLADYMKEAISNITHDTIIFHGNDASGFKVDFNKAVANINKFNEEMGVERSPIPKGNVKATYTHTGPIEAKGRGFLHNLLASGAAAPHSTMSLTNMLLTTPPGIVKKGLSEINNEDFLKVEQASHVLAKIQSSMMMDAFKGYTGVIAATGVPGAKTAGELFYRATHMPGFNVIRRAQIHSAASVGYAAAHEWAADLLEGGTKAARAEVELQQMRLDPKAIASRGGQLTDEEKTTALFHFVNDRFFLNRPQDRGLYSNANWFMRSATMFHQTVNSQFYLYNREFRKLYAAGDYKQLAILAGGLLVAYPTFISPVLHSAEVLLRTASPTQAVQSFKDDEQKTFHPKDMSEGVSHYIDMLSYAAATGVFMQYVKATKGSRMLAAAVGPVIAVPLTVAGDAGKAILNPNKEGVHNFQQTERDLLELGIPVAGKWLAHHLVPTKKESNPPTRAPRALRKRKGNNERTIGPFKY